MSTKKQMSAWTPSQGLERLLSQETNISDLIQMLSGQDATPWEDLVDFVPEEVVREASSHNKADLLLISNQNPKTAVVEVKLGHEFSEEQREKYEAIKGEPALLLAGLDSDAPVVAPFENRWKFLALADLFGTWMKSQDPLAGLLATKAAEVLKGWDSLISGVMTGNGQCAPLNSLTHVFLTRVVSRRIAWGLQDRNLQARPWRSTGSGLGIVQAWAPTRCQQPGRHFIAEVRWKDDRDVGELRFGVAFDTEHVTGQQEKMKEEAKLRAPACDQARSMDTVICFAALDKHLQGQCPAIAALLRAKGVHCRPQPRGDWLTVIENGFPKGENRRQIRPDFWGDGTLCYEAIAEIDFTKASGVDLIRLLEAILRYLQFQEPASKASIAALSTEQAAAVAGQPAATQGCCCGRSAALQP